MSTLSSDVRRKAIRRAIARRAGVAPNADAIAQATLDTWQQIAAQMESVIGARGVDALFTRSLHVVGKRYRWLEISGVRGNAAVSLATIKSCFESQDATVAIDAACELLTTFAELLASLIGESLTARIVDVVWLPLPSESHKKAPP